MDVPARPAASSAFASAAPQLTTGRRILVAEDDDQMRALMARTLRREGYEVVECCDGFQLIERLGSYAIPTAAEDFDLIISDIQMPRFDGLEVLEGLEQGDETPPLIVISAFGDDWTRDQATRSGAAAFLDKPFPMSALVATVRDLLPGPPGANSPRRTSPRPRRPASPEAPVRAPAGRRLAAASCSPKTTARCASCWR